jgi:NlpC/P60 family putative phage cell wall peptidase
MITREGIIAEARAWLGTRWHHQASRKGVGCDCIGLIAGVARELGVPEAAQFQRDTRFRGYGRTPEPKMLRAAIAEYLDPAAEEIPGDILLMRFDAEPQHFGFLSSPDYMIHAYAQARKVVENRIDDTWRRRIVGAYRFRGLE